MAKPLFTSDLTPLNARRTFVKTTEQVSASRFTLLPPCGACAQGSDDMTGGHDAARDQRIPRGGFRFFAAIDQVGGE